MNILVLNHHIQNYAGSEINALQLSQALIKMGHHVDLGTFSYGPPMQPIVEENEIRVIDLLNGLPGELHYDLIWAHHAPVLAQLIFYWQISPVKIIFSSLGTLEPLEAPPIFSREIPLIMVNSHANQQRMIAEGVSASKIYYFPNYAPEQFFSKNKVDLPLEPVKIAIISNHIPDELNEFAHQAVERGCIVDLIGITHRETFVDEQILLAYDLVITIGKTVQYCFALKIPVYCYDYFGGPGYLDERNFSLAQDYNFSGRGFDRHLSGDELARDIFSAYESALQNLDYLYRQGQTHFCLETNLKTLLQKIETLPLTQFDSLRENNCLAKEVYDIYTRELKTRQYFYSMFRTRDVEIEKQRLDFGAIIQARDLEIQRQRTDYEQSLAHLRSEHDREIDSVNQQIEEQAKQLEAVSVSRGWRLVLWQRSVKAKLVRPFSSFFEKIRFWTK
jgi:hypothetical protein